jgi:hypothetical protein
MKITENPFLLRKMYLLSLWSVVFIFAVTDNVKAQEDPPRPITVTATQSLAFGTFYQGAAGGTVTINSAGTRSNGGTVVLLTMGTVTQAIFEIVGNIGTPVSFLKPTSSLTDGSGHTLTFVIDDTNPGSTFVLTNSYPIPTLMYVGGILTIGSPAANPPGNYNGTFDITFVQE